MSSLTKIEREMKSIFDKAANLVTATKMEGKLINKFKNTLTDLKIMKEEIEKNRK